MGYTFQSGGKAAIIRPLSGQKVFQFAALAIDLNPLHLDKDYGNGYFFRQRVVLGMLVARLFSGLIDMKLSSPGSIYLGLSLSFKALPGIHEAGVTVIASTAIIKVMMPIRNRSLL